jgi:hypothetical protein
VTLALYRLCATSCSVLAGLDYKAERESLLELAESTGLLPPFVRRYRDLDSYWQFIKRKFGTYAERREFLWSRPAVAVQSTVASI